MYKGTIKSKILTHLGNVSGWRTKRKIVVIESDDWGNIRLKSKEARQRLIAKGLDCNAIHYDSVDALESNTDLEFLFEVLSSVKDKNGKGAVFTPMCNLANPDFDAISKNENVSYVVQPLHKTIEEYSNHDRVLKLWKEGYVKGFFDAGFHNREHFSVSRVMRHLHQRTPGFMECFEERSLGILKYRGQLMENYINALHPDSKDEILSFHSIIEEGCKLFEQYFGHPPQVFIAPNAEEPKELESTLSSCGIKYLTRSKRRRYPLGDGRFEREINWLGKTNELGQICISRNCFFEPVTWGEHNEITDWVDNCLKEIEISFKWNKPAVISSHRVNYTGTIEVQNRDKGLRALKKLLDRIVLKWPDIEFMSSSELGQLIGGEK
ncbi:hypothetical protein MASR2M44_14100 [Bacteroidota bacterium]